jgi:hypothetical protein
MWMLALYSSPVRCNRSLGGCLRCEPSTDFEAREIDRTERHECERYYANQQWGSCRGLDGIRLSMSLAPSEQQDRRNEHLHHPYFVKRLSGVWQMRLD